MESRRKRFCVCILGERRRTCEEDTVCADKVMGIEMDKKRME